jgi:hypothetical protein
MYTTTNIELPRLHREGVARQVENNRLARQLRVNCSGKVAGFGGALRGRFFARFPGKGQPVPC